MCFLSSEKTYRCLKFNLDLNLYLKTCKYLELFYRVFLNQKNDKDCSVNMDEMRLNKFIAACGIASRREADRIIEEGRVLVNGKVATKGLSVRDKDVVTLDGKAVSIINNEKVVYAYYKPRGVTTTEKDPHAEITLEEVLNKIPQKVTYAGRLDKDSEGLLLLTNDGMLIDGLMRGRFNHEKEYIVTVNRPLKDEDIIKMSEGIFLKELNVKTKPCRIEKIGKKSFKIVLTQGLNRQIRRMCRVFGYEIITLKRVRVANIELANMKIDEIRQITGIELQLLYKETANNGL